MHTFKTIVQALMLTLVAVSLVSAAEENQDDKDSPNKIALFTTDQAVGFILKKFPKYRSQGGYGYGNWEYAGYSYDIKAGGSDFFDGIEADIGLVYFPENDDPFGDSKYQWGFPVLARLETEKGFDTLNGLLSIGATLVKDEGDARRSKFCGNFGYGNCFFTASIELGKQFKGDTDRGEDQTLYETEETDGDTLRRFKIDAGTQYILGKRWTLIPKASVWYDDVNNDTFHKAELKFVYDLPWSGWIGSLADTFYIKYENGSGSPYFNNESEGSVGFEYGL